MKVLLLHPNFPANSSTWPQLHARTRDKIYVRHIMEEKCRGLNDSLKNEYGAIAKSTKPYPCRKKPKIRPAIQKRANRTKEIGLEPRLNYQSQRLGMRFIRERGVAVNKIMQLLGVVV